MIPESVLREYPELEAVKLPRLVTEAMKVFGVYEFPGDKNNPIILGWAKELADAGYEVFASYDADSIPWCTLGLSFIVHKAGYDLPKAPMWSQSYRKWGLKVEGDEPGEIGDIAVFVRDDPAHVLPHGSLGHAAVVIRAEPDWLHCIGANQSDAVNIRKFSRINCVAVRCPPPMPVRV